MISSISRSLVLLTLCTTGSAWAQQPTVTFSGHVTDQNTRQGIVDVAIVAQGNQTGTRVVISDANGNYTLPFGANTNIKLRAYKSGFIFNPALVGFASIGGPPITGNRSLDFTGTQLPFPILILAQPPMLLTEDESLVALALDCVLQTRDPFTLVNNNYLGSDKRTRIKLFLIDLDLYSGETLSIITVQARDAQQRITDLPVEDLRKVPGFPWLAQLTVLLPGDLVVPNDLMLSVAARGQESNRAMVRVGL